jgi:hypothetical protein
MSWGKNTSFPPLQIVVWIIQFCPQRWIYQESSGWSSAWESQFAGKSLDLIVEFLWKWGRPVTDPLKLETAGDTASNPWEKDRCMLKQSHIVHIYIYTCIYICVCLAFLWHVCFPPKKNPSSARLGSWQLVILETLCGAACQVTLSSWTWKILWDPVERMLIADDEWKFWCWKWINCLYLPIIFYMSFNVVLQSSCFLRMGIPVFFIQEWWMVMFPRTQFFVKLGRQNLPSVGTWEFWHIPNKTACVLSKYEVYHRDTIG